MNRKQEILDSFEELKDSQGKIYWGFIDEYGGDFIEVPAMQELLELIQAEIKAL